MDRSTPSSSTLSVTSNSHHKPYRNTRQMPYRLQQVVAVYLDNTQFLEGFTLLHTILTSGRSTPAAPAVPVPPASFFELAATLIVHPQYTTRARSPEDLRAADEALRFLRDTVIVVGCVAARLSDAFLFRPFGARDVGRRKRKWKNDERFGGDVHGSTSHGSAGSESEDDSEAEGRLRTPFASGEKSLFRQKGLACGFWSVVGWAFNCSVRHKKRWERWKVWLEVMCDVMEEDLGIRTEMANEAIAAGSDFTQEWGKLAEEALIAKYLKPFGQSRGSRRRVVSALFADGSEKSMREFQEVWKNETKERKKKRDDETSDLHRSKKIDLMNDQWGDYSMKDEDDDVMDNSDDQMQNDTTTGKDDFGGAESIKLRQRLLILCLHVSAPMPQLVGTVQSFYDVYTEYIRALPLPIFRDFWAILSPPNESLPVVYHIALLATVMLPFLANRPPQGREDVHTQELFMKYYLPFSANGTSYSENAKYSLLIEHLLFYMWTEGELKATPELRIAVEKGIKAREAKAVGDGRRKDKGQSTEEQNARVMLEMSGERIRMLLDMIQADDAVSGAPDVTSSVLDAGLLSSSQLSDITQTPSLDDDTWR